jgi:predicted nucleotide-binding protein
MGKMDTLSELKQFHKKVTQYRKLVEAPLYTDAIRTNIQILRDELQRGYSRLESKIKEYGGLSNITDPIWGAKQNVFDVAFDTLDPMNYIKTQYAIGEAIKIINRAIGKLEAEGESWGIPKGKIKDKYQKPKAFISHSKKTQALTELRDFLDELEIEKLIVINKPNLDREINIKVEAYLDDADFVIILATGDSRDRNGIVIPAGNVLHEIGLAQAKPKFKGKIIYLLEEGTEFPSNIKPKSYIRFNRNNIDYKFGDIVKEIRVMGFLV